MFDTVLNNFMVFLLVLARIVALIQTAPLLSSSAVPQIAKLGLGIFAAVAVLPWVLQAGYPVPDNIGGFVFVLIGEIMIGVITGFLINLIFAVFQAAGQFFAVQMGFGASEVFDPLARVELPVVGQFTNLIAMFVFVSLGGFQKLFLTGVYRSFQALKATDILTRTDGLLQVVMTGLGKLFEQALIISLPVLGTLLIVSVSMGLLAKAAPQMNLLMLGFPISIGVAFIVMFLVMPFIMEVFASVIDGAFDTLLRFFPGPVTGVAGGAP